MREHDTRTDIEALCAFICLKTKFVLKLNGTITVLAA
jgi:hypothetical protein